MAVVPPFFFKWKNTTHTNPSILLCLSMLYAKHLNLINLLVIFFLVWKRMYYLCLHGTRCVQQVLIHFWRAIFIFHFFLPISSSNGRKNSARPKHISFADVFYVTVGIVCANGRKPCTEKENIFSLPFRRSQCKPKRIRSRYGWNGVLSFCALSYRTVCGESFGQ